MTVPSEAVKLSRFIRDYIAKDLVKDDQFMAKLINSPPVLLKAYEVFKEIQGLDKFRYIELVGTEEISKKKSLNDICKQLEKEIFLGSDYFGSICIQYST